MHDNNHYTFENVWSDKSAALQEEIISFWLTYQALPSREAAEERLPQVIILARDETGAIAAVSTVYRRQNEVIRHPLYYFRCFVSPDHRRRLLAARLIIQVRDFLNDRFRSGGEPEVIGMGVEAENQGLNAEHRRAIWPHSGFVFIGWNARGQQVRVYYFDDAEI